MTSLTVASVGVGLYYPCGPDAVWKSDCVRKMRKEKKKEKEKRFLTNPVPPSLLPLLRLYFGSLYRDYECSSVRRNKIRRGANTRLVLQYIYIHLETILGYD